MQVHLKLITLVTRSFNKNPEFGKRGALALGIQFTDVTEQALTKKKAQAEGRLVESVSSVEVVLNC